MLSQIRESMRGIASWFQRHLSLIRERWPEIAQCFPRSMLWCLSMAMLSSEMLSEIAETIPEIAQCFPSAAAGRQRSGKQARSHRAACATTSKTRPPPIIDFRVPLGMS